MYYLHRKQKNYFIYLLLFTYLINFGSINNCFAQIKHTVLFSKSDLEMITEVERDGNTYTKIAYNSMKSTKEIGKPCLPVKYIKLIIPAEQDVKNITIDRAGTSEIQVSYPITPAQLPVPLSIEDVVPEFVSPDPKTYYSDANYPTESVELVHSGYFDGNNHIVTLAVYPIQYNPKSSKILFNDAIDFTLNLTAGESPKIKVQSRNVKNQKIYDTILKRLVDNPEDLVLYQSRPVLSKVSTPQAGSVSFYEYVVITRDSLASCFNEFITWKKRKGLNAGVVTIEDILTDYSGDYISGIYDDAGSIRQYLSDAYQSGTVWALIAGDHITSPIRYGAGQNNALWTDPCDQAYKIPADLYFADFTGDWNVDTETPTRYGEPYDDDPDYEPEIFVGRLPVSNSQEISNWVEKVLLYEQNPGNGDYSYLMNAFWIRGANIWVSPNTITPHCPPTFDHEVWEYGDGSYNSGSEVVTEMSDHYGLLNWHCHGGTNVFRVKALNETNRYVLTEDDNPETQEAGDGLDNMTNNKYYSVVYSICCLIAAFDDYHPNGDWYMGESMAEGFTNMFSHICGPNLLGNTRDGYQDDSPELQCEFYDLITDATDDPNTYGSYLHLGVSELVSKDIYNDHFLSYSHNLFGCPETRIWTATPSTMTNASVTVNSSNIVVNAGVTGCDICVSSGNNGSSYYLPVSDVQSYTFSTSVLCISRSQSRITFLIPRSPAGLSPPPRPGSGICTCSVRST